MKSRIYYETTNDHGIPYRKSMDNGHIIVLTSSMAKDIAGHAITRYNEGEITRKGMERVLWGLVGGVRSENHSKPFESQTKAWNSIK